MTATCPPSLQSELLSTLGIVDCHVIRAPTDRAEISYNVKVYQTMDEARDGLVREVRKRLESMDNSTSRGLVYCRSKSQVEEVATLVGCKPFHADLPMEKRVAFFKEWVNGKQKFMACSSLLGCGVDVKGVDVVFHLGTPWSILDFVQESGRAGRGGNPSVSTVFASRDEREPDDGGDMYGKRTIREWVLQRSLCRRIALSSFLDGGRTTCMLLQGAVFCDVCRAELENEHPRKLFKVTALEIPRGDIPKFRKLPYVPPTSVAYETDRSMHHR